MKILAIETSCDETAIALVKASGGLKNPKFEELSSRVLSQVKIHQEYGGVFPALAKREHSRNLIPILKQVLKEAGMLDSKKQETPKDPAKAGPTGQARNNKTQNTKFKKIKKLLEREPELLEQFLKFIPKIKKPKINKIAVTYGPGLEPALWVGINFAKALSEMWNIPVVPVNHMEGHIASVLPLQNRGSSKRQETRDSPKFPAIALLVSGGHTELVLIKKWGDYKVIGQTRDDAVGEAYDKVARMLDLSYPGGPQISALAEIARKKTNKKSDDRESKISGNPLKDQQKSAPLFPRPMIDSPDLDFSFSGLKTSVLYHLKKYPVKTEKQKQEIAKEFEEAVVDVLTTKTQKALQETQAKSLIVAGGVSANKFLRKSLGSEFKDKVKILIPPVGLSTDNALMIAMAGYLRVESKKKIPKTIRAQGNLEL